MVAIFIDESGNFRTTPLSMVAALSLPHASLSRARRELAHKTEDWPRVDGELKGGQLSVEHLLTLVDVLFRHQALLHGTVATVGEAHDAEIEAHRLRQCELMTRNLTPEHHAGLVAEVWELRQVLERMSNQLYTQFVAQTHLLCAVIEEVPTYFSQRRPKELALFEWFVDAKDKDVTPQERWWRNSLASMIQSRSLREPFARVKDDGFNYKHFEKAYGFRPVAYDASQERKGPISIDVGLLVTKRLKFPNSKDDILIQAVDILARSIRRALKGTVTPKGPLSSEAIADLFEEVGVGLQYRLKSGESDVHECKASFGFKHSSIRFCLEQMQETWFPLRYFAKQANLDRAGLVKFINATKAPALRRTLFTSRVKANLAFAPAGGKAAALLAKWEAGATIAEPTTGKEAGNIARAIMGLKSSTTLQLSSLLSVLRPMSLIAQGSGAASTVRRAFCRTDEIYFPL